MIDLKNISTDIGLQPVNKQQPQGDNVRYDDDFEALEDELARQGALIDRGKVNWKKIAELSILILEKKSKDLKVSCYLIRALYETNGFEGLALGLKINLLILENYWDKLYPEKARARANAYAWLTSKIEPVLEDCLAPSASISVSADISAEVIEHCFNMTKSIEEFLLSHLDDQAPALGNMRRSLNDILVRVTEQQKPEQPHIEEQTIQADPTDQQANQVSHNHAIKNQPDVSRTPLEREENSSTEPVAADSAPAIQTAQIDKINIGQSNRKERMRSLKACQEVLRDFAAAEIREDINSPSAYVINRMSTWLNIDQLPMNKDGITPLRPVPADKKNQIFVLFEQQKYKELIPLAESSFSRSPFWLDAHRIVALSLEALGLKDCAEQVKSYLANFLRRFPDIIHFKFNDQSEFADSATRQWINKQVVSGSGSSGGIKHKPGNINTTGSIDKDLAVIQEKADDLVSANKLNEAVLLFQKQILKQTSQKEKIYWKFFLAQFCFSHGKTKISISILKEIDGFLQTNNLQYWEPELATNVTHLLYQCLNEEFSLNEDFNSQSNSDTQADDSMTNIRADIRAELTVLYTRLCQLDPVRALEVS